MIASWLSTVRVIRRLSSAAAGPGADFARRALEAASDDPVILANAAFALAYFGEEIGAMMALVDRALALNPNYARGWHLRAPRDPPATATDRQAPRRRPRRWRKGVSDDGRPSNHAANSWSSAGAAIAAGRRLTKHTIIPALA
jgi:hypothetical protein